MKCVITVIPRERYFFSDRGGGDEGFELLDSVGDFPQDSVSVSLEDDRGAETHTDLKDHSGETITDLFFERTEDEQSEDFFTLQDDKGNYIFDLDHETLQQDDNNLYALLGNNTFIKGE